MAQHYPSKKTSKIDRARRDLDERRTRARNSRNRAKARRIRIKEAEEAVRSERSDRRRTPERYREHSRKTRRPTNTGYVPRRLRTNQATSSTNTVTNNAGYYVPLQEEVSNKYFNRYTVLSAVALLMLIFIGIASFFDGFDGEDVVYERAYNDSLFEFLAAQRDTFTTEYEDNIYAQETFINYFGLVERAVGRTYIPDSDETYTVALNSLNQLQFMSNRLDDSIISTNGTNVTRLKNFLDQRNIQLMYVNTPVKFTPGRTELPVNVVDYSNDNVDRMLAELKERNITTVDLREDMNAQGIKSEDIFFWTDHHWTADGGIWSADVMLQKLAKMYPESFKYDASYFQKSNYNITVLEDFFLGTQGRRVGAYYIGKEDFLVYSPKFETNFTVQRYFNGEGQVENLTGSFDETIVCSEALDPERANGGTSNGRATDTYSYYTGSDMAVVRIINNDPNATGRIVMVKDSFARMTVPFLACGVKEICMVDLRHYKGSLYEYIEDISPDLVMLYYNSDYLASNTLNFSKNIKF